MEAYRLHGVQVAWEIPSCVGKESFNQPRRIFEKHCSLAVFGGTFDRLQRRLDRMDTWASICVQHLIRLMQKDSNMESELYVMHVL